LAQSVPKNTLSAVSIQLSASLPPHTPDYKNTSQMVNSIFFKTWKIYGRFKAREKDFAEDTGIEAVSIQRSAISFQRCQPMTKIQG
jgi:hypothetical protein